MNDDYWSIAAQQERLDNRLQVRQVSDFHGGQSNLLPQSKGGPNIGNHAGAFLADVTTFGSLARAEQATRAHYERTGDWKEALWLGGIAGRRWNFYYTAWVFLGIYCVIAFFGMVSMGMAVSDAERLGEPVNREGFNFIIGWALSLPICWSALLVLHKRNIDFGLHHRGTWYHLALPLAKMTNWLPNWMLYSAFTSPLVIGLLFLIPNHN